MANAKKCDRCGTFYMNRVPIKIKPVTDLVSDHSEKQLALFLQRSCGDVQLDLCPACVDKLVQYFNDGWREQK